MVTNCFSHQKCDEQHDLRLADRLPDHRQEGSLALSCQVIPQNSSVAKMEVAFAHPWDHRSHDCFHGTALGCSGCRQGASRHDAKLHLKTSLEQFDVSYGFGGYLILINMVERRGLQRMLTCTQCARKSTIDRAPALSIICI